jgi:hypothetical protein
LTIRPVEFWSVAAKGETHLDPEKLNEKQLVDRHQRTGFAYHVEGQSEADLEGHDYGDTSMTLEWLLEHAPGWQLERLDRSLNDRQQRYVYLRAI